MGQFLDLLEAEPLEDQHTRSASLEARVGVLEDEMKHARLLLKRLLPMLEELAGGGAEARRLDDLNWRLM